MQAGRLRVVSANNHNTLVHDLHNLTTRKAWRVLPPKPILVEKRHSPRELRGSRRLWQKAEVSPFHFDMEITPNPLAVVNLRAEMNAVADAFENDAALELRWINGDPSFYFRFEGTEIGRPENHAGTELDIEQLLERTAFIPEWHFEITCEPNVYDVNRNVLRKWMTV